LTTNGLDTVGDRDFALDYTYAVSRMLLHASRLSTDFIDFASGEFGFLKLDGQIACGSSMMPQKKNPDVFELIRGKSGKGIGNVVSLFVTLKGLPGGYNRDLQEDRAVILETGPLARSVLSMLSLSLPRVTFDKERCLQAISQDATQATDLAEALVKKGVPFRTAYQAVGALVRRCQEKKLPLAQVTVELGREFHPKFDEDVVKVANPNGSVARKENAGGTGPISVKAQIAELRRSAKHAEERAAAVPRLSEIFTSLREVPL
jgi:argininosuccinate lyase